MTDLYLISTFSHEWNRAFNLKLEYYLEERGLNCYFAHRDTDQAAAPESIFRQDIAGILQSKTCLAVAQHETPNWGAEVGIAYGKNIPVIALAQTDHAIPLICHGMISESFRIANLDAIDDYIDGLVATIRKHMT